MSEFYLEPAEVSFSSVTGARAAAQLREELKQVKIHVFAGIKPVAAKQPAAPGPAAAGTLHLNPAAQKHTGAPVERVSNNRIAAA